MIASHAKNLLQVFVLWYNGRNSRLLLIRSRSTRAEHKYLAAILCAAGVLAVGLVVGSQLTGQVSREPTVAYKTCRYWSGIKGVWKFEPHESCGIDAEATRIAQETQERTEALRRKIEAEKRVLTPQEEQQIDEHLEQQFLAPTNSKRKTELEQLFTTTATRLHHLLSSPSYDFTTAEADQLRATSTLVATLSVEYNRPSISKKDISRVQAQLDPLLTKIQVMLTHKARNATAYDGARVETFVTRTDHLVAQVGTVIRDVDRAGEVVPAVVRNAHQQAVQLVRQAKRDCSTTRPTRCKILLEAVNRIASIQEPLCTMDSPLLHFCH